MVSLQKLRPSTIPICAADWFKRALKVLAVGRIARALVWTLLSRIVGPRDADIFQAYSGSEGNCPICLEKYDSGGSLVRTACQHVFHFNCIVECARLHQAKCPLCRANISDIADCYNNPKQNSPRISTPTPTFMNVRDLLEASIMSPDSVSGSEESEDVIARLPVPDVTRLSLGGRRTSSRGMDLRRPPYDVISTPSVSDLDEQDPGIGVRLSSTPAEQHRLIFPPWPVANYNRSLPRHDLRGAMRATTLPRTADHAMETTLQHVREDGEESAPTGLDRITGVGISPHHVLSTTPDVTRRRCLSGQQLHRSMGPPRRSPHDVPSTTSVPHRNDRNPGSGVFLSPGGAAEQQRQLLLSPPHLPGDSSNNLTAPPRRSRGGGVGMTSTTEEAGEPGYVSERERILLFGETS